MMTHAGKARKAAFRLIAGTLLLLLVVFIAGFLATIIGSLITAMAAALVTLWFVFALLTLFFFRDPDPLVPTGPGLVVSPAHGKVDVIDEVSEPEFIGGPCRRISIFLSVWDIHVQNMPVGGRVGYLKYRPGKFLNAMKEDSAAHNENYLLGIESNERPGEKVGVRLIAGLVARRIVPYVSVGETLPRGDRIGLIQYGSRVDLYLPVTAKIRVKVGDKVAGGHTVVAAFE